MAKKRVTKTSTNKSSNYTTWGVILLIIGILYLGQDLAWWNFWKLSWWTVSFILVGIWKLWC